MKRRGLTRFVALATAVSLLGSTFSVSATTADNKDNSALTTTNQTAGAGTTANGSASNATDNKTTTQSSDDGYVNELTERNYTKMSKKYTAPKYTGEDKYFPAKDAWVSTSEGVLTSEINGYEKADQVVDLTINQNADFVIKVEQDGVYDVYVDYLTYDAGTILPVEMSMKLNGETPFYEAKRLLFECLWKDSKPSFDRYDNEIVSIPDKQIVWQEKAIMDASYRYSTPLALELKAGDNKISLGVLEGSVRIGGFTLKKQQTIETYKTGNKAEGDAMIELEAERPFLRNDSSIRPTCEFDCDLSPYNVKKKELNMVDGDSYKEAGQSLAYEVKVDKAGYYYLGYNYRQADKVDFPVFVDVKVDGVIPNDQMQSYPFDYVKKFTNMTMETRDGSEKLAVYLEAGTHELTLTISNDNIRTALETVDEIMSGVNDLALEITKVAGTSKDKYRSITLTDYIPDVVERMNGWADRLDAMYDELSSYSDAKECGTLASIKIAVTQIRDLASEPNKIPYRITELAQSTSSANQYLANFITEINNNKMALDRVYVYQDQKELPKKSNIFKKMWEAIKRFFASFGAQSYSVDNVDKKKLQVWVARSRQYLEIIQKMIDEDFTPKTGIEVELCIMPDPQKLILSNMTGDEPDVAQAIDYAMPFELAIRGALKDLTEYPDYADTLGLTAPGLLVPSTISEVDSDGKIENSIYSMPETFYFWLLYYRTDIMEKLNLEIPQTLEDVKNIIPALKNRGLDFYYPTAGTVGVRSFAMTMPILYQHGASLYGDTCGDTTLGEQNAVDGFTALTDLFTIYNIAKDTPSFYQHFRNGDMPIGVADYFMYNQLTNAAPEIENSWSVALVPGVADETGEIQRQTSGGAQSTVIFKKDDDATVTLKDGSTMKREDAAWEYLKWYMSTDVQVEFGTTLQTTYGKEFIWNSANIEAMKELPWDTKNKATILEQMTWITESPRLPGTYMLEREVSNAYVNVVVAGDGVRTSLDAAIKRMNRETDRKLDEFGYTEETGRYLRTPNVDMVKEILGK